MPKYERVVNQDYVFALVLDENCELCNFEDNSRQLRALEQRGETYPEEKRATDRLAKFCELGCKPKKSEIKTISAKFSCLWRC